MEREILTAALSPGPDCLSLEQLGRYRDGRLPAEEQAAAAGHVGGCLSCQAELSLMQAVMAGGVRSGEEALVRDGVAHLERRASEIFGAAAPTPAPPRWFVVGLPSFAAAVVLAMVAGAFYLRAGRPPTLPADVSTGGEVTRSLTVAVRGPIGDVGEAPRRLEWLAVARAVRYRVRLMEVDRRELWSTSTPALGADLPAEVRAAWAPARTLVWDVTAYDASGTAIAESGPQSVRLVLR